MDLRLAVLPEGAHPTTFLRLPHPRTGQASLYLPYTRPTTTSTRSEVGLPTPLPSPSGSSSSSVDVGLLELQVVQPPVDARRSWFVDEYVVSDGRMNLLTPCDPVFVLIPMLEAVHSINTRSLPYQDLFETAAEAYTFGTIAADDPPICAVGEDAIRFGELDCVRSLVERVCDVEVVVDDLRTYRWSLQKTIDLLKTIIERLASQDAFDGRLPALRRMLERQGVNEHRGLDEKLVQQARIKVALDMLGNYLGGFVEDHLRAQYQLDLFEVYSAAQLGGLPTPGAEADDWQDPDPRKMDMGKAKGGGAAALKRKATKNNVNRNTERLKKVDVRRNTKLSSFFKPAGP